MLRTATLWVNGQLAGDHARKGYTAFTLDITRFLYWGQPNVIAVHVDNTFDEHMVQKDIPAIGLLKVMASNPGNTRKSGWAGVHQIERVRVWLID